MLKNLITINLKWVEAAFYTGAALGLAVGSLAGTTVGVLIGAGLAFVDKTDEKEELANALSAEDKPDDAGDYVSNKPTTRQRTRSSGRKAARNLKSAS